MGRTRHLTTLIEDLIKEKFVIKNVNDWLIDMLLRKDGSTTRMIESLVGSKIDVKVHYQQIISKDDIPQELKTYFPEKELFLHRITSLYYKETILSQNVVFADLKSLSNDLQKNLELGKLPVGKLINEIENRRKLLWFGRANTDSLSKLYAPENIISGEFPIKKYLIIRDGQTWFYICEIFQQQKILDFFWSAMKKRTF